MLSGRVRKRLTTTCRRSIATRWRAHLIGLPLSVTGSVESTNEAAEPENDSQSKGAWGFESDDEVSESDAIWTTREEYVVDESPVFPFDRVGQRR